MNCLDASFPHLLVTPTWSGGWGPGMLRIVTPVPQEWQFSCWVLSPFLIQTPLETLLPWNTLYLYPSLVGNGLIETLVTYIKIRCTHLCAQSSWGTELVSLTRMIT